jgi:pseudouridine synthase
MEKTRLNKFLAESGCCSRRKADEAILAGHVRVNGEIVREMGIKIDPVKDEVNFKGQIVKSSGKFVYYALNKPKNVVSTSSDDEGRQTVVDFVPKEPRVYPVGRLDFDSEGLIILTNDGDLTNRLTHPSFEHEKEYRVECKPQKSEFKVISQNPEIIKKKLEQGLKIDGQFMRADKVKIISPPSIKYLTMKLTLHTGLNRQIRRMCDKIGLNVVKLVRIRIGKLKLEDLNIGPGEYKEITKEDIL